MSLNKIIDSAKKLNESATKLKASVTLFIYPFAIKSKDNGLTLFRFLVKEVQSQSFKSTLKKVASLSLFTSQKVGGSCLIALGGLMSTGGVLLTEGGELISAKSISSYSVYQAAKCSEYCENNISR